MNETIQIIQLVFSFLIIPVLGYIIRLERRLTRVETKLEMAYNLHCKEEKEREK
jgi:hypothetical protein